MAKKRAPLRDVSPGGESTPAERITWLLNTVWGGNRSEMARAVGVTHSVLTKVASGQQGPGRRLMAAIASHPKINPGWLLSGEGEPLVADSREGRAEGWAVPIAVEPLPGPLDQHRDQLSAEFFPTAGAFYRATRYWLRVSAGEPALNDKTSGVHEGDLLLIETDPAAWKLPESVDGKLCLVRLPASKRVELAKAEWTQNSEDEPEALTVDTFRRPIDGAEIIERIIITKRAGSTKLEATCQHVREFELKSGGRATSPVHNIHYAPIGASIQLRNIVGLGVLLVRTL